MTPLADGGDDAAAEADGRRELLAGLGARGLVLAPDAEPTAIAAAWRVVDADVTFEMGGRLYEHRPWSLQELTRARFAEHVRLGEVLVNRDPPAVAILPDVSRHSEDRHPHLALAAGDGRGVLTLFLAVDVRPQMRVSTRFPDPDPPILRPEAVTAAWRAAGIVPRSWSQHILERRLPIDEPLPPPEPTGALELRERPRRIAAPPAVGT